MLQERCELLLISFALVTMGLHDVGLHYVLELQTSHAVQHEVSWLGAPYDAYHLRYGSSFELSLNVLLTNHYLIDLHPFCASQLLELN